MIALKNILVPHDFSETAESALAAAVAIARRFGAALHVLHVTDHRQFEMGAEFPLGLDVGFEDIVRTRLLETITAREQRDLRPSFAVLGGAPPAEIVRYAKDHDIDLIVMGTHGRGFVTQALIGSVAAQVVGSAPCPVLTVRQSARNFVVGERSDDSDTATAGM